MGLVRTWAGQLARAAGASLIAPLVLLLAASVVASGGGLGSFGSLREIASGPSLPDVGLSAPGGSALENAEIVGAGLSPPADTSQPPPPATETLASATPPASESAPGGAPATPREAPSREPSKKQFKPTEPPTPGAGATPTAPPSTPPPPAVPAPVQDLLEATRGLGDTLREPLAPLTNSILDLLRIPPPR